MIASIGSAVALLVFMLVSAAHFRVRSQTNARWGLPVAAIARRRCFPDLCVLVYAYQRIGGPPRSCPTRAWRGTWH
jgi:hypothetical protein